ncbi:hypothetical protein DAPPUDRAFT_333153 [Daphnia pulex]|uniref:Uncharacterized protein n=1 Tax=Daphnia pulex TaxID=6669 RepID=E9HS13_DAPPU|nr:hypothetical protein DAPPUDRAFT_333153 [Daphnia pulex]|eukprot:EFX65484.1 hypothetical protein DAPPUDRAFT_333153 [Daphnia pulex]
MSIRESMTPTYFTPVDILCFKNYSSHSNARAHYPRKNLEEYESTEDPDMDRTAMEDVREKKAARKNVLVTDALKSEIRVEGVVDVFYITCSFEVLFKQMLKSVVARDKSWANLSSSIRFLCVLSKVNVIRKAESFLDVDDGMEDEYLVEDAYLLLLSAEVDSNEPVMISCAQKLNSQQSQFNEAKVARHWVPSINYAVGLVMNMTLDITRPKHCVILSWDECFREEGSRQKWGLSFIPVTNKYRLNQPFYHIIQFETSHFWRIVLRGEAEKNLYIPQEFLQLHHVGIYHDLEMPPIDGLGIYFELFDGRRYVPNAEHKILHEKTECIVLQPESIFKLINETKCRYLMSTEWVNATVFFLRENIDNLRSKYKFRQPGRDEPEPLPHPSDAQPGPSGNAAAAGDHDGGEVWSSRGSRGGLRDELRNQSAISDTIEQAKEVYQCTSSNEWCFKNYSSHSNARTHSLRKHLEENDSTEDPDMDRTALEDVSDKKATKKNVLVTDAIKSEIRLGLRRPYGRGRNQSHVTPWKDEDAYSRPRGRGGSASRGGPSKRGSVLERLSDEAPLAMKPRLDEEECGG